MRILTTILLIIACIVAYMYFFGKGDDKAKAREIVAETKELGQSVGDFLKRQKEKYDDGEFDRLLDRIGDAVQKLKKQPKEEQEESKENLKELETELRKVDPDKLSLENRQRLEELLRDIDQAQH